MALKDWLVYDHSDSPSQENKETYTIQVDLNALASVTVMNTGWEVNIWRDWGDGYKHESRLRLKAAEELEIEDFDLFQYDEDDRDFETECDHSLIECWAWMCEFMYVHFREMTKGK